MFKLKCKIMKNEMYEAPQVEVIEVEVEKGFQVSGGEFDRQPI